MIYLTSLTPVSLSFKNLTSKKHCFIILTNPIESNLFFILIPSLLLMSLSFTASQDAKGSHVICHIQLPRARVHRPHHCDSVDSLSLYYCLVFYTCSPNCNPWLKKKKKPNKNQPSNIWWPHPLQVNVILIISHSKKEKIISMFFSAGVPNRLSTNCQFPYSQKSQFPPSSKIIKSRDKNDFTSTYPFHKLTVRNLPCARY